MDLHSDNTYWLLRNGLSQTYASLQTDLKCDVAVLGAGITGALCARSLVQAGFDVVQLDRRHGGQGSTAASTALLQYEIDTPLWQLTEYVGEKNAVRSYRACLAAIHGIRDICSSLGDDCGFDYRPSLYFASAEDDLPDLEKEYALRRRHGFELEWFDRQALIDTFGFDKPGALLSADGAQIDAFCLTRRLLADATDRGLRLFENTEVVSIEHDKAGVLLTTAAGACVRARKLVIACGYESQHYLDKAVEIIVSSYAAISEPMPGEGPLWHRDALIWETARPYLYLRTTPDRRILIGGLDEPFYNPQKRDALVADKTRQLTEAFGRLFPEIPFVPDFQWAGSFVETRDGLPYIGPSPQHPDTFFALGFGGNGITFSWVAARLLTELLQGRPHPDAALFAFDRVTTAPALSTWWQTTRSRLATLWHDL